MPTPPGNKALFFGDYEPSSSSNKALLRPAISLQGNVGLLDAHEHSQTLEKKKKTIPRFPLRHGFIVCFSGRWLHFADDFSPEPFLQEKNNQTAKFLPHVFFEKFCGGEKWKGNQLQLHGRRKVLGLVLDLFLLVMFYFLP